MAFLKTSTVRILLIVILVIVFMYIMNLSRKTNVVTMIKIGDSDAMIKEEAQIPDLTHKHDDQKILERKVEKLKRQEKALLVTVVNDAYIPFAHNWLCHTQTMNIHEQVLVIVLNETLRYDLSEKWPNIDVIAFPGDNLNGNRDYHTAGYVRILVQRAEVLLKLLKNEIAIFLFELDSLWIFNPIPAIEKYVKGYDIIAAPVPGTSMVCTCFMYMKPTGKMINLFEKLTEMMRKLGKETEKLDDKTEIPTVKSDQPYISNLLNKRYGGIRVTKIPVEEFPDGKWYSMRETEKEKIRPLVIHNNWIVGNGAKIARAKRFHHWFWDAQTRECDTDLVKATINH